MFVRTYRLRVAMTYFRKWLFFLALCFAIATANAGSGAKAETAHIAVAANFAAAMKDIAEAFHRASGHDAVLSFGSTGQLYAQITQGAPFDVFLAADNARPEQAVAKGYAVVGSRFTYATGRLALFAPSLTNPGPGILEPASFDKFAIANPETAPYGRAAVETLRALGVYDALSARLVRGNNIAQTFQFVRAGSADAGFVALSQIRDSGNPPHWLVPENLHAVIAQDAVLLRDGKANEAALAFLIFLRGPDAGAIKARYGYGSGD